MCEHGALGDVLNRHIASTKLECNMEPPKTMRTELRASTDPTFDADTIIATLSNGSEIRLYAYVSDVDGVPVVQIDTDSETPGGRLRIYLNDGPIWDGDPDTDEAPGAEFVNHPVIRDQR